jgi:hypothetical protein
MEQVCNAIKATGEVCGKNIRTEGRCGLHHAAIIKAGPNATALKELKYRHRKQIYDFGAEYRKQDLTGMVVDDLYQRGRVFEADVNIMKAQHRREVVNLKNTQDRMIRETGIDPDRAARQRADDVLRAARLRRREAVAQMQARHQQDLQEIRMRGQFIELQNEAAQLGEVARFIVPAQRPVERELANFAADAQNVHTTEAVRQTKDIVERIRQVEIPDGYRWHPVNTSKTPFEIGLECRLSQRAAWQMMSQYAQNTAIYDIEEGIYGKVLDCVWQFVKNSPDKEDLCKILKNEMEDNVGMCAQGNLSRICNILAGYMDGVGSQESLSERLGNIFSRLSEIENPHERFGLAYAELKKNDVPENRWSVWLLALVADDGDEEVMAVARSLVV